ncbi:hypothetical protein A7982_12420 [Minicystis rosea]|nr:hypothetical protein A7982_12420 [Minicystis rosea]
MKRTLLLAFAVLAACTPAQPGKEAATSNADDEEGWVREAKLQLKQEQPPEASNHAQLEDLLKNPDPPAATGPELETKAPPAGEIAWPAPPPSAFSVRYRIPGGWCGVVASEGCHLAALCPIEASPSAHPSAEVVTATRLEPIRVDARPLRPEVLNVPSARCELRLYASDQHGATICTARVTKLPSAWEAGKAIDLGELRTTDKTCVRDPLASRSVLRGDLARSFRRRTQR